MDERGWMQIYQMLEKGADIHPQLLQQAETHKGAMGQTFFHWVCLEGSLEAIQRLIVAGVNIDSQNALGNTALMEVAAAGREDVFYLLKGAGADMTIRNHDDEDIHEYLELYGIELPDD
ncbi:MAG: ankyrin repeat domain-containing protein [Pseudomonadota bacterium]